MQCRGSVELLLPLLELQGEAFPRLAHVLYRVLKAEARLYCAENFLSSYKHITHFQCHRTHKKAFPLFLLYCFAWHYLTFYPYPVLAINTINQRRDNIDSTCSFYGTTLTITTLTTYWLIRIKWVDFEGSLTSYQPDMRVSLSVSEEKPVWEPEW